MFDRLKRNNGRQRGAWCAVVVVLCLSISGSVRADLVQYWTFDTDGANSVAYLDGEYASSAAFSTALSPGGDYGIAGRFRDSCGTPFDGKVDDVAVWNTVLSPDSIAHPAAGAAPTDIVERNEPPGCSQVVNVDIASTI